MVKRILHTYLLVCGIIPHFLLLQAFHIIVLDRINKREFLGEHIFRILVQVPVGKSPQGGISGIGIVRNGNITLKNAVPLLNLNPLHHIRGISIFS